MDRLPTTRDPANAAPLRFFAYRRSTLALVLGGVLVLGVQFAVQWGWRPPTSLRWVLFGLGVAMMLGGVVGMCLGTSFDSAPREVQRRYLREFLPAMAGYVLGVFVSMWLIKRIDPPMLRGLVALLPIPGIALAMRAMVRYIRDTDEMQRRIELEAICIATLCVSLGYLAAGFLQSAGVIAVAADAAMFLVFPLVCVVYGIAKLFVARRFQ